MNDAIQQVIDRLTIDDVAHVRSAYSIGEKYLAMLPDELAIRIQLRSHFNRCDVADLAPRDPGDGAFRRYRFIYDLGVRVLDEPEEDSPPEEDSIISVVEARMYAQYLELNNDDRESLDTSILNDFGRANGLYHVWPYWREYVQSALSRLRLPNITLPMFRLPEKNWGQAPHVESRE